MFGGSLVAIVTPMHPDGSLDADSDWPEEFKPLAREAFRRADAGELSDGELYWAAAVEAFVGPVGGASSAF